MRTDRIRPDPTPCSARRRVLRVRVPKIHGLTPGLYLMTVRKGSGKRLQLRIEPIELDGAHPHEE